MCRRSSQSGVHKQKAPVFVFVTDFSTLWLLHF